MNHRPDSEKGVLRRRNWFAFSLRTLFVLTTLLACLLGWQLNKVRERKTVRQQLMTRSFSFTTSKEMLHRYPTGMTPPQFPSIPLWRQWLGDEAIAEIWISPYQSASKDADRKLASEVFPEAEIREALFEPCHPGCFPAGTLVLTPHGKRAIQTIEVGDLLCTVGDDGNLVPMAVESVFVTTNRLWSIATDEGELITTETQPLCVSMKELATANDLAPGDHLLCARDGKIRSVVVTQVKQTDRTESVYNLVLSNSEIFVAADFLARSKPPADSVDTMADRKLRQVLPVE